jgi:Concanavalin A-like lectin/glucanases superfamily
MQAFRRCSPLLALALATACTAQAPIHTPATAASNPKLQTQAVNWGVGTLHEVYNPSGNIYSYAPSVIVDGSTEHIWTCHNRDDGVIKDYIYDTKRVNGTVVSSVPVLTASASGWDSVHNCDPSVVRSTVNYNGTTYNYAMFYLGNDVNSSSHNYIGVAFAQDIAGPWTKYPNPLLSPPNNGSWGVGQPSVTSIDGQGRFLLFYTDGTNPNWSIPPVAYRRDINLGNMSNPVIGAAVQVTNAGLVGADGSADYLNNYDVAYEGTRDRFFAIREVHPYPTTNPNYIGRNLQLISIEGSSIWNGGGTWRIEGNINPGTTDFSRNHNGGLKRTPYGSLANPSRLEPVFTRSCAQENGASCPTPEWTYDLWEMAGNIDGPGLVGWWKFDENAGSVAYDASGLGRDATLSNAPGWTTGKIASATALNGSNQAATAPSAALNTASSFSVCAWVRLNSTAGWQTFLSQDGNAVSGFYLEKRGDTNEFTLSMFTNDSITTVVRSGWNFTPSTNTWYHLCGVRDVPAGQIRLYGNGTLVGTTAYTATWNATGPTVIGRGKYNGSAVNFVNGNIDDVRAYNYGLAATDMTYIYNGGSGRNNP